MITLIVKKVTEIRMEDVEFDVSPSDLWSSYRRMSADNWEVLMGESWEPQYPCEKLEEAYQEWKNRGSHAN